MSANSLDHLLFFTNKGKVYAERGFGIPEADRNGKGTLLNSLMALEPDERITATACVPNFESGYFVLCTRNAKIKRVRIADFSAVRSNGLIAMSLDGDDQLPWAKRTSGGGHVILVTKAGQSIRFKESEVRVMGRQASGVNAIRFREGDQLAGLDVITPGVTTLLVITSKGYGKRTPIEEYPLRGRFGLGVRTIAVSATEKLGPIVSAHTLRTDDDITVITREGMALRTRASTIRLVGRATRGVRVIHLAKKDEIVSVAVVEGSPAEEGELGENGHSPDDLDLSADLPLETDMIEELGDELSEVDENGDIDELITDENGEILDQESDEPEEDDSPAEPEA